eukprot:Opistho-2@27294
MAPHNEGRVHVWRSRRRAVCALSVSNGRAWARSREANGNGAAIQRPHVLGGDGDLLQQRTVCASASCCAVHQDRKVLRACSNFNSLCAIVTGLQHFLVQRMAETWERVSPKHMAHLKKMTELIAPARNMMTYRSALLTSRLPLVPLLPLVMKDLTFINDGNPSKVDGLVNFEKLRMLSRVIRTTVGYVSVGYDPMTLLGSLRAKTWAPTFGSKHRALTWTAKGSAVYLYLENLPVVSDEGKLYALAGARNKEDTRDN